MAALCIRPTDCLDGRAFFGAQRGVLGAPPAPRRPVQQQQQGSQFPAMASPPVPGQQRAARGRPSGRQRGRRSPTATGSPPHKRVMENVVILKRGEQIPPVVTAAPPAGCQDGVQAEKATEPVAAAAKQSDVQAEKAAQVAAAEHRAAPAMEDEPVAAAENSDAQGEERASMAAADERAQAEKAKAAEAVSAETVNAEAVAAVDQSVPKTKEEEEEEPSAATSADQSSAQAAEPDAAPVAAYSSPAFVAAPEPRSLPIPVLLLKRRGAAARPPARDDGLAGATAAAA
ncbi:hypothetical protein ACP70R_006410 [Stipagrostis hirtigluma subsp. patula]